ncbi:MAG: PspC domain-containing protein [Actinobacteria bacterium]|nr:PspC domain-containing protein [Actinomycetota bacterium]
MAPRPVLYRRDHYRIGGVCGGIADHLGVRVWPVRIVFVLLNIAGGLGLVLYVAFAIVLPRRPGADPRSKVPAWVEYLLAALTVLATFALVFDRLPARTVFVPALLACLGGALIWRQASSQQRDMWWRASRTSLLSSPTERGGRIRLAVGAGLVIAAAATVFAGRNVSIGLLQNVLLAVVVTLFGIALITGPWWVSMVGQLSDERRERIRSQERAEIAAHLHDSVLQTLALIQRNAGSSREVARLARGQERELRNLLYGEPSTPDQLAEALRQMAGEIEDAYAVTIDVVLVGDVRLDDRLSALVAATREAMVNAAKHASVATISLYAEVGASGVETFVKDRGVGFVLDEVGDDRQGVRGSIIGRIERHGGQVRIRSTPGEGTEIAIRMDR